MSQLLQVPSLPGLDRLLVQAVGLGDASMVRVLLDHGANPNTGVGGVNETALGEAARLGYPVIVGMLVAHGARPDGASGPERCTTPMHYAVVNNHSLVVAELLEGKADPNGRFCHFGGRDYPRGEGPTPLMIATRLGRSVIVSGLIAAGADASLTDADGRTAMDWLREYQSPIEEIRVLLAQASRQKPLRRPVSRTIPRSPRP